nr:unnamed protein product [Callosobruchus chinensis]
MSLNHSTYTNQLTFEDLDEITEHFFQKMQEYSQTLYLQAEEMNKWSFRTSNETQKLESVNRKLALLKYLQSDITTSLNYIAKEQGTLEEALRKVECDVCCKPGEKEGIADIYRRKTYTTAEDIHKSFIDYKRLLDEFDCQVRQIETKNSDDVSQFESFAQVLQAHLQQLEMIEMKTIQMKSELNHIEFFNAIVSQLYHVK